MVRRLHAATQLIDQAGIIIDEVSSDLGDRDDVDGRTPDATKDRTRPEPAEVRPARRGTAETERHLAAGGAAEFSLEVQADGSATARVNGKKIPLSPTLAFLLYELAADRGLSPDKLVAWKSVDEVADRMAFHLGRTMNRHAFRQNLCRLRARFEAAGVSRELVQLRGPHVRFALRRDDSEGTASGETAGTSR